MTSTANPTPSLTIRRAQAADGAALARLAQLDSAPPLDHPAALVAEVDGELLAALPLGRGRAIANPFRRTADLVALLESRAAELEPQPRPVSRRGRLLGALRLSPAGRA
jgi:hypothetical protein